MQNPFRKSGRNSAFAGILLAVFFPAAILAQKVPDKERLNPLVRNPQAIEAGKKLYGSRATLCANCHGAHGRGEEAPDLYTSRVILRGSDQRLFEIIKDGVPGGGMPPNPSLSDEEVWQVAAYLQSLARPGRQLPVAGDPRRGGQLFDSQGCRGCHMIGGAGGFLGPDLSDAAERLTAEGLRNSILAPAADIRDGFRPITVITPTGQRVTGLRKNDSNFSLEILREDGSYFRASRDGLRELPAQPTLMPSDYRRKLAPGELQDLLAFLDQQRALGRSADFWLVKAH